MSIDGFSSRRMDAGFCSDILSFVPPLFFLEVMVEEYLIASGEPPFTDVAVPVVPASGLIRSRDWTILCRVLHFA